MPAAMQAQRDKLEDALKAAQAASDQSSVTKIRSSIGNLYRMLGDECYGVSEYRKALDDYNQALPMQREAGDRDDEAATLNSIGLVYSHLGEAQKALESFNRALALAMAVNDPLLEAVISRNLLESEKTSQPALAIFYGKQAIDLLQQVRGNLQGLDRELQKSFFASESGYYRDLADLLIDQGRLPEAQHVLNLLKVQEYLEYTRSEMAMAGSMPKVASGRIGPASTQVQRPPGSIDKLSLRIDFPADQAGMPSVIMTSFDLQPALCGH